MNEADAFAKLLRKGAQSAIGQAVLEPCEERAESSPLAGAIRFWTLIVSGIVASALWLLVSVKLAGQEALTTWMSHSLAAPAIDVLVDSLIYGGLLLIAILMMWLMPIAREGSPLRSVLAVPLGLSMGLGGMGLALLMALVGHHLVRATSTAPLAVGTFLVGSVVILFEAFVEEVCFRAWIMRRLKSRIGGPSAVVAAALAFSLLHTFGGARSVMSLGNIFLAGLFFGVIAWRTGAVWASVAAHFGWNWSEASLFGLSPNPGVQSFGSLMDFDIQGPSLWGGSVEGLNASIEVTVVMVCLIWPLLQRPAKSPYTNEH